MSKESRIKYNKSILLKGNPFKDIDLELSKELTKVKTDNPFLLLDNSNNNNKLDYNKYFNGKPY